MIEPGPVDDQADARHHRLLGIKLRALAAGHLGVDVASIPEAQQFAPGSALVHDGAAWIYLDDRPAGRLGAALAWSLRSGAAHTNVVAEAGTGTLARRAARFDLPLSVWHADGRNLLPAVAEPVPVPPPVPGAHLAYRPTIEAAGAAALSEHGVLVGEVRGLEICRVVDDPHTGSTRLEVGVGAHDREAFQMLHGDEPTSEALARVVATVASHRTLDAQQHPLNRLAAERFVRWRVIDDPSLVGAASLSAAEPPVPRGNVKDPVPCVAAGVDADGGAVVVVCSAGVDLDLVPYAADARLAHEPSAGGPVRLVLALPARDRVRLVGELADRLRHPVEFATVG